MPKVVTLYDDLFWHGADEVSFSELFLLKPRPAELEERLATFDFLEGQDTCRQLFFHACQALKREESVDNALLTLTIFLQRLLTRRYYNYNSAVIALLAGIEALDTVFSDFVSVIDSLLKGLHQKAALRLCYVVVTSAYQSTIVAYFLYRDLFGSLIAYIGKSPDYEAVMLLTLLCSYNKFEMRNIFQTRLGDLVDMQAMNNMIAVIGKACRVEESNSGGALIKALSFVGFGGDSIPTQTEPSPILFALYELLYSNKAFGPLFLKSDQLPTFITFISYLATYMHESPRTRLYAKCSLLCTRLLFDDPTVLAQLNHHHAKIRICRHRPPVLPEITSARPLSTGILDVLISFLDHNLRKRLDIDVYRLTIQLVQRLVSSNIRHQTRLVYHWSELWRSLLTLMGFLPKVDGARDLADDIVHLLTLCLSNGASFLPGTEPYDDLFYKLVQSDLQKFAQTCDASMLMQLTSHYRSLIGTARTSEQVAAVIKSGYDSIELPTAEQSEWKEYKEATERTFVKTLLRDATASKA